jgi:hypothetical protein
MKFTPGRNFAGSGGNVQRHMGVIVSMTLRSRWLRLAKIAGRRTEVAEQKQFHEPTVRSGSHHHHLR